MYAQECTGTLAQSLIGPLHCGVSHPDTLGIALLVLEPNVVPYLNFWPAAKGREHSSTHTHHSLYSSSMTNVVGGDSKHYHCKKLVLAKKGWP